MIKNKFGYSMNEMALEESRKLRPTWFDMTGVKTVGINERLKTTMSRVADDKLGQHLPAKLIGAVMKPRGKK